MLTFNQFVREQPLVTHFAEMKLLLRGSQSNPYHLISECLAEAAYDEGLLAEGLFSRLADAWGAFWGKQKKIADPRTLVEKLMQDMEALNQLLTHLRDMNMIPQETAEMVSEMKRRLAEKSAEVVKASEAAKLIRLPEDLEKQFLYLKGEIDKFIKMDKATQQGEFAKVRKAWSEFRKALNDTEGHLIGGTTVEAKKQHAAVVSLKKAFDTDPSMQEFEKVMAGNADPIEDDTNLGEVGKKRRGGNTGGNANLPKDPRQAWEAMNKLEPLDKNPAIENWYANLSDAERLNLHAKLGLSAKAKLSGGSMRGEIKKAMDGGKL